MLLIRSFDVNRPGSEAGALRPEEILGLMHEHRLSLSAVSVLGLFLLIMNGAMAFSLRSMISAQRAGAGSGGGGGGGGGGRSKGGRGDYQRVSGTRGANGLAAAAFSSDDEADEEAPRPRRHAASSRLATRRTTMRLTR